MKNHIATGITVSRVFVSLFFYIQIVTFQNFNPWILLTCFALIELSDILDGFIARRMKIVSDLGKLLDPLCDVSAHFLAIYALQQVSLAPASIVIVFVLREIWVQMVRMQLLKINIVLAAKTLGKIKTWFFGVSIFMSLMIMPNGFLYNYALNFRHIVFTLYYLAGLVSILSGLQYFAGAVKAFKEHRENNTENNE